MSTSSFGIQTCIITGADAGIGLATAKALSHRGCRVILACRSIDKALQAAEEIRESTDHGEGSSSRQVDIMQVSLTSLASVQRFCETFNRRKEPLDILVLNAGIMGNDFTRRETEDGFEEHFQINHLSQWLIAQTLISEQIRRRIRGSSGAAKSMRVIFLTSSVHMAGNLDFDDLQLERTKYSGFKAYSNSKLMNVLAARHLQSLFDRQKVCSQDAAVAVHPGMVQTNLAAGWLTGEDLFFGVLRSVSAALLTFLSPLILEPTSRAARTVLFAAISPREQVKGGYVAYGKPRRSAAASHDPQSAHKLWMHSLKLCGKQPGILEDSLLG